MTRPFHKVLVANRGEIAARIIRTCHTMGLSTVAVYSDADRYAVHVTEADQAVHIGPSPSRLSYLDIPRILDAASRTGADAIHPGYGFLAENAEFAQACIDAGLVFVGPSPDTIQAMGSKIEAKRLVSAAGVPIVPGYNGDDQSSEALIAEAHKVGFPLLLKASAGGGGKGMRVVRAHEADTLGEAIAGARREAEGAFGDPRLMIERYIEQPRHIEFQILGDHHGGLVHLFERECSIQRRHQKIIEETPSTALSPELRNQMGEAAVKVGRAIGYQNAGTVEFILAPSGEFYFLEVNTRLQVEHPITEMVTGLDLVREQLRVAAGEALGYDQESAPYVGGAAVECRVYAEDPAAGFLPSTGTLLDWSVAPAQGLRVDTGVVTGSEVSVHYDPMLAKLITWGPSRSEATAKMVRALRTLSVAGVRTNRNFLIKALTHPEYTAGNLTTHFIDDHLSGALSQTEPDAKYVHEAAIAATLVAFAQRLQNRTLVPHVTPGFRNNHIQDQCQIWRVQGVEAPVAISYRILATDRLQIDGGPVLLLDWSASEVRYEGADGLQHRWKVVPSADGTSVWAQSAHGSTLQLHAAPRFPDRANEDTAGGCSAPMPGQVIKVAVEAGQTVAKGDLLVILEAMKMEHSVRAPADGVVAEVCVSAGQQVDVDALLVVVEPIDA